MPKKKPPVAKTEIVNRFAAKLRELRTSRGLTQAELARQARVAPSYLWRLESGAASPGIDLIARLAETLGTTVSDLLPDDVAPDSVAVLQQQAQKLFDGLLASADRDTLLMLCPLLARLGESPTRRR